MLKLNRVLMMVIAAVSLTSAAMADDMKGMKEMKGMEMSPPAMDQAQGVGIVKAVDPKAGTVTIAHEPIKAFSWPAMNMKFKVADPAMLKNVMVGNKVRFTLQGKDMMKTTVIALGMAE